MKDENKEFGWIVPSWILLLFGVVSFFGMWWSADVMVENCLAIHNCKAGEGILQGLFMLFISLPLVIISFLISLKVLILRKIKHKDASKSHSILLTASSIVIFIMLVIIFK